MATTSLRKWLTLIFVQCLIYSYVVECSVSQSDSSDCEFPEFNASSLTKPSLTKSDYYPLNPWWIPASPLIPFIPTPVIPPPPPPPLVPEQSKSPLVPKIPRRLIPPPPPPPPPLAQAQSTSPFVPQTSAEIKSPPISSEESNTGWSPRTQPRSESSSSSFKQLQFGQEPFLFQGKSSSSFNRAKAVATAIGVTLAITIIAAGVAIFLILKYCKNRKIKIQNTEAAPEIVTPTIAGGGGRKDLKGLIVDEKGQDIVYWRKDNERNDKGKNSLSTESYDLYKQRVRKEKDNIHHQSSSLSTGDKKSPLNAQAAMAAPEAGLPPLFPSRRKEHGNEKENLKPLQREEVSINVELPKTWPQHNEGSLSYDGDIMEAMFGSMANKRRTSNTAGNMNSTQIFIIDPQRSQNIASILRSIKVSRQELLLALNEGKGLNEDTLRELSRITPTKREESLLLSFRGHPPTLAQAESFLYHTMNSVSFAFPRINAMLFKLNFRFQIHYLDEHIRTLQKACHELRENTLLFKLIKATLNAGNEIGANHFLNLTSLWKIFKTTLIESVVEKMAISEGKQCVIDRDTRLNLPKRNMDSSSSLSKLNLKKFMILGLPLLTSLSAEFQNTRKAATVDYYTYFLTASSNLATGLNDIRETIRKCNSTNGGFVIEMKRFVEEATEELSEKTDEQMKVIQLVKRTTEYYNQSGASSTNEDANPFQLFSTVNEFLDMVDQACKNISENLQRRKTDEVQTGLV